VFGLGRKKAAGGTAAQMSPEAMAMLTQMAQQDTAPQAAAMAPTIAPAIQPANSATGMSGQIPERPPLSGEEASPATDDTHLAKKEQRRLLRARKKAAMLAAKEEKARLRRQKKGAKSRFSRARYLREANGNAAAGVALACLLVLVTMFGPLLLNTFYLLPQTAENREIAGRVQRYNDIIAQAAPLLQAAVSSKAERETDIQSRIASFREGETAASRLRQLIADLEQRGAVFSTETSRTVTNSDVGVAGLVGKTLTMDMKADFLSYLLVRNKFSRAEPNILVTGEEIVASPGDPVVSIKLLVTVPARQ